MIGGLVLFEQVIKELNAEHLLSKPQNTELVFPNERKVLDVLKSMIVENKRAFFYGDYDADGAYALEDLKETCYRLGYTNYSCFNYKNRTHKIDMLAVNEAISGGYEVMVICDAGSSSPDVISYLRGYGLEIVLLDHHESSFSYEDFPDIAMINVSFDRRYDDTMPMLSAGALVATICIKLLKEFNDECGALYALAISSMYADVVDMSHDYCRNLYYKAVNLSTVELPRITQRFIGNYKSIQRRFIEYQINPKINTLFRAERFNLLNPLLHWTPNSGINLVELLEEVDAQHAHDRTECKRAADLVDIEMLDNFVLADLSSLNGIIDIPSEILHNYTGRLANELISKYNKTAIVLADSGSSVKGSLRDSYGRNYLELFRTFCNAEGHPSAFGIGLSYYEVDDFLNYVRSIDKGFAIKSLTSSPITLTHNLVTPDMELLENIALYNEFSGVNYPTIYIDMYMIGKNITPTKTKFGFVYKWGETSISSSTLLRPGSHLVLKPYVSNRLHNRSVRLALHEIL